MRTKTTVAAFVVALACLLLAPSGARAQATDFRWAPAQTSYQVPLGGTLDVPLYLWSTTPTGASLLSAEDGLFSAGLSVRRTAGAATIAGIEANRPVFDDADPTARTEEVVNPTLARLKEERVQSNGSGSEVVGADRRVRVGTVRISAAGAPDQTSTFQIRDFVNTMDQLSASEETITGQGTPIDSRIAPSSFTVTTVPEPSALALVGVGAVALVRRRRRA